MQWVAGLARDSNRALALRVQDENGTTTEVKVRDFKNHIRNRNSHEVNLTLQLGSGGLASTKEYLDALGLPKLDHEHHRVYEIRHDDLRVFIPAQLLTFALLGPTSETRQALFSPQGIGHLAVLLDSPAMASPGEIVLVPLQKLTGHLQNTKMRLLWQMVYPSASAAAASIYRNALDGNLAVTLPSAEIDATTRGVLLGKCLYVTSLVFKSITPTEPPLEFAEALAKLTILKNTRSAKPSRASRLSPANKPLVWDAPNESAVTTPLTEAEATQIVRILAEKGIGLRGPVHRKSFDDAGEVTYFQERLDTLRMKFYGEHGWKTTPAPSNRVAAAQHYYRQLKRRCVFEDVMEAMSEVLKCRSIACVGDASI